MKKYPLILLLFFLAPWIFPREPFQDALFISCFNQDDRFASLYELNLSSGAVQLISGNTFRTPEQLEISPNGIVYFSDPSFPALFSYDRKTSETMMFSSKYTDGVIPTLPPQEILWLDGNILVRSYDYLLNKSCFYWIDPETGKRTSISYFDEWTGFSMSSMGAFCPLSDGDFLVISPDPVGYENLYNIVRMDPVAKTKTLVASVNTQGENPPLTQPVMMCEEFPGQVLILNFNSSIKRLNTSSGAITPFVSNMLCDAICVSTSGAIYGALGALEDPDVQFFSIDSETGEKTVISSSEIGTGPLCEFPVEIRCHDCSLYALNRLGKNIYQIDTQTGDRRMITKYKGQGPLLNYSQGICLSPEKSPIIANSCNFPCEGFTYEILSIDPITGNRNTLSNLTEETGGDIRLIKSVSLMTSDTLAALIISSEETGFKGGILKIDAHTGKSGILSDETHGSGPLLEYPDKMDVMPDGTLAISDIYLTSPLRGILGIVLVNPVTGDRRILCDSKDGKIPPIYRPYDLAVGKDGYIYLIDIGDSGNQNDTECILRIHPVTGDRSVFLDPKIYPFLYKNHIQGSITTLPSGDFAFINLDKLHIIKGSTGEITKTLSYSYPDLTDIFLTDYTDICYCPALQTSIRGGQLNTLMGEFQIPHPHLDTNLDSRVDISDFIFSQINNHN